MNLVDSAAWLEYFAKPIEKVAKLSTLLPLSSTPLLAAANSR